MPKARKSTLRPTPLMFAALEHLAASSELAVVRTYSGWWVRESEREAARGLGAHHVDLKDRLVSSGAYWALDREPLVMIPSAVVHGLAARGLMKFTGAKRRVRSSENRLDYHRAELTAAGRELMAIRVEEARKALGDVLAKLTPGRAAD